MVVHRGQDAMLQTNLAYDGPLKFGAASSRGDEEYVREWSLARAVRALISSEVGAAGHPALDRPSLCGWGLTFTGNPVPVPRDHVTVFRAVMPGLVGATLGARAVPERLDRKWHCNLAHALARLPASDELGACTLASAVLVGHMPRALLPIFGPSGEYCDPSAQVRTVMVVWAHVFQDWAVERQATWYHRATGNDIPQNQGSPHGIFATLGAGTGPALYTVMAHGRPHPSGVAPRVTDVHPGV
jgi:hypothetical protein